MNLHEWMTAEIPELRVDEEVVSLQLPEGSCRMRYQKAGVGLPLILLHGLLGTAEVWNRNLPFLAQSNTVYALDQLVCEQHGWIPKQNSSIEAAADRLAAFMDAVGIERAQIVGHSYGGSLAIVFAAKYPHRTGSLVLLAPTTSFATSLRPVVRFWQSQLGRWFAHRVIDMPRQLQELALTRMYGDARHAGEETLNLYLTTLRRPGMVSYIMDVLENWGANMRMVSNGLNALRAKDVLLVWGEQDRTANLHCAAGLMERLPRAELHVFPEAGHLVFDELPHETNLLLREWLARTEEGSDGDARGFQVA